MIATLDALLDQPVLLLVVLAAGAAIGIGVEKLFTAQERARKRAYWQGRNAAGKRGGKIKATPVAKAEASPVDLAADQLRIVMRADFRRRALLNKPESNVFKALDQTVIVRNREWQVMAQVCLGEFLASEDADAYRCINSKRVDFVLMDEQCHARHAPERLGSYQGAGHHQGSAAARDAVKKEALRKAGIGYHEVVAGHTTPAELKRLVEKLVPPAAGAGRAA